MQNKYSFWEEYNKRIFAKLENLCKKKRLHRASAVRVDFHMHSDHSSDATQSISDILNNTKQKKFDIISITDHDSVSVYNEMYENFKDELLNEESFPVIITGTEHTVSFPKYGEMCHILKHFINPLDRNVLRDIETLEKSYFHRASMQIKLLHQVPALNRLLGEHISEISEFDFLLFLQKNDIRLPDYWPLIEYVASKLELHKISFRTLFAELKKDNLHDKCEARRLIKQKRFAVLDGKYQSVDVEGNRRFLLSILAVHGVDESNYPEYPSTGNLSVFEYGQPSVFELNESGITSFAHPTEKSLPALEDALAIGGKLIGVENNFKNKYQNPNALTDFVKKHNLVELKGSDMHSLKESVYDDLSFYDMDISSLEKYLHDAKIKLYE